MDKMQEVLHEVIQNYIQVSYPSNVGKLSEVSCERSRLAQDDGLEMWKSGKSAIGKPGNLKLKKQVTFLMNSDYSNTEPAQDKYQQSKGLQLVNKWKDLQVMQDEISTVLCVKPLSQEERTELKCLHHKRRKSILKSSDAEGWQQVRKGAQEGDSNAGKPASAAQKPEQNQRKVPTLSCQVEEQIQQMIQEAIRNERKRQRAQERLSDSERQARVEEALEETRKTANMQIAKIHQELEIERDRNMRMEQQARKRQQCLKERVRRLERQIEEMKGNAGPVADADAGGVSEREMHQDAEQPEGKRKGLKTAKRRKDARCRKGAQGDAERNGGLWQKSRRCVMAFLCDSGMDW